MHIEKSGSAANEQNISLEAVRQMVLAEEEGGYDVPFATFTWQYWQDLQARFLQNMARFQRAIEQRRIDVALFAGLEAQELATDLLKEACSWIGVAPKPEANIFAPAQSANTPGL